VKANTARVVLTTRRLKKLIKSRRPKILLKQRQCHNA